MIRRMPPYIAVFVAAVLFTTIFEPLKSVAGLAQGDCRTFSETGKQVCGRFLQYWQENGGLSQQGLPLTNEFQEASELNGQIYTVQYFERAVFEKHPENAAPFDVLLSQLGTFQLKRKYPNGDPSGLPVPTSTLVPTNTPVPSATPQPTATPLPDIKTQVVEFTVRGNVRFRAQVTEVIETKTGPGHSFLPPTTARGKFIVVRATLTNMGTTSAQVGTQYLKLRDNAGRTFDMVNDFDIWYPFVQQYDTPTYSDNIQPGVPTPMVFIFDIPEDVWSYYLVPAVR